MLTKRRLLLLFLLLLILGANDYILSNVNNKYRAQMQKMSSSSQKYPLLSRQIDTESENDLIVRFIKLRQSLRDYVIPMGDALGFYFEYLPTGESIGVNEKIELEPASLLKVPLAIAFYNHVENTDPNLGQMTVTLQQKHIDNRFGDLWKRGPGAQLTLDEDVKIMLTDSDNTAALLLTDYVPEKDYEDIYTGLDIDYIGNKQFKMTIKGYTSILKSLYYSSILSFEHSQLILNYLTQSKFNDKLVAGVPANIKVAHKIGVLENNLYQDCGIVYLPKRPYALCMFSKSNEDEARIRMKKLSKMVYDYVSTASD